VNLWGQQRYDEQHPRPSIEDRWEERRMFFWTVRQALAAIALAALTVYFVVALAEGHLPDELLSHPAPWELPSW
jgi:hypothetical protein